MILSAIDIQIIFLGSGTALRLPYRGRPQEFASTKFKMFF